MPKQDKWLAECWRIYPTPWRVVHRSRRAMIVAANGNEFMNGINIGKADLIVEAINALGRVGVEIKPEQAVSRSAQHVSND